MRILKTQPHLSNLELKEVMASQTIVRAFQDWQIIYLVQTNTGKTADEIASFLSVKKSKVYKVIEEYNKHGLSWRTYNNWGGRREERCLLSIEEEAMLLKEIEADALSGKVLIYKNIKAIIEKRLNKSISDDYVWDLFKRHGWSKKVPRKHHPKSKEQDQIDFKKNSKKTWMPNH